MFLYYFITPTKTISLTEYLYYFLIGAIVIVPVTGYIQYQLYFKVLSSSSYSCACLGPIEEIAKILIPLYIIHFHSERRSMSVTDIVLIGIAVGCSFGFVENLLYFRTASSGGKFNFISGSFFYSEYNSQSITFFNHFLYPAFTSIFLGLKNRFSKSIFLSIIFYILALASLAYSMFIHGFFNYCNENSFFGMINYPNNKTIVSIYNILLRGKYLDDIFIILLISIVLYEVIVLYKASKQVSVLCYDKFSFLNLKQKLMKTFKGNLIKSLVFILIIKKNSYLSKFIGRESACNKYESILKKQLHTQIETVNLMEVPSK